MSDDENLVEPEEIVEGPIEIDEETFESDVPVEIESEVGLAAEIVEDDLESDFLTDEEDNNY